MENLKTNKYLEFYKKYYGNKLPSMQSNSFGLCNAFMAEGLSRDDLNIFKPTQQEEAKYKMSRCWWLSQDNKAFKEWGKFTLLRQIIVLFLANMEETGDL